MAAYTVVKPKYTDRPFLEEVVRADKDYYKKDVVYEFSNDRKFEITDNTDNGCYDGN